MTPLNQFLNNEKIQSNSISFSLLDFEEIFLGAIIGGITDADDIIKVKSDYFAHKETKRLFDIVYKIVSEEGWIDFVKIQTALALLIGQNESKQYLDRVVLKVPEGIISSTIIREIETIYIKRKSLELLDESKRHIQANPSATEEIILKLHDNINSLISIQNEYNFVQEVDNEIESIIKGTSEKLVIQTGLNAIDKVVGGIATQEVTFLGARPGHGKTTMCIALSLMVLDKNPDIKLVFFSLEMSKSQLYRRYIANLSGVSSYKIRIGDLTQEEIVKIGESNAKYQKYMNRLFIYDDIYDLITMKKVCKSIGAKLVIVDFVTLMDEVGNEDKRNQLGHITKLTKRFVKTYNMGWIYVSQLNRDVEKREGYRPVAGDLSESDQLTQLAGDILLLQYYFKYSGNREDAKKLLLIYDKARYAGIDDRRVQFDADLVQIRD